MNAKSSQSLVKYRRGGDIQSGQYHYATKTKDHKKSKAKTNILYEYKHKDLQQNTSKPNKKNL